VREKERGGGEGGKCFSGPIFSYTLKKKKEGNKGKRIIFIVKPN